MARVVYKPLIHGDNTMRRAEEGEISVDVNDQGHIYVFDDYKIPQSKTKQLWDIINSASPDLLLQRIKNDKLKITNNLNKRYNKLEDIIFGKYQFDFVNDRFDYDDNNPHNQPSLHDRINKLLNDTFFGWQKIDYCKSVYEYNRYHFDIMTKEIEASIPRLDFLEGLLNDSNRRYDNIRNIIIDEKFWNDIINEGNNLITNTINKIDSLPGKLETPTFKPPGITVPPKEEERVITYYEYGFLRYMSNNSATYPGDLRGPRSDGWYNYSSSPCTWGGVVGKSYDWYGTKPVPVLSRKDGKNETHHIIWSPGIGQNGFIPSQAGGNKDFTTTPTNVNGPYGKWTFVRAEWYDIADVNWGKSYDYDLARSYSPSSDPKSAVQTGQKIANGLSTDNQRDPDQVRNAIRSGNYKNGSFYSGTYHRANKYGKMVRITYKVEKKIKVVVDRPF